MECYQNLSPPFVYNAICLCIYLVTFFFQFFLKATQLDQIKEDYSRANQQKHVTDEIIEQKIQVYSYLHRRGLFNA